LTKGKRGIPSGKGIGSGEKTHSKKGGEEGALLLAGKMEEGCFGRKGVDGRRPT